MNPERWQHLKQLFATAQRLNGDELASFLEDRCTGDPELRAELESLLNAAKESGSFLEAGAAAALLGATPVAASSILGRRFGPYLVQREIGRGGMGLVYQAVRDDDVFRKEVALKLLPSDLESAYFEKQFRRERQILASLEHPNIARLLDGGADEAGRPYYVMELVEGLPIDAYCQANALGLEARLKLIRAACSALALAHSRLVVHCDLKPSNVLVTADGTLKLLDFGIAKLLGPDAGGPTQPATTTGPWLTPEYASPEQVRGEPVSTATDIYALGVLLYELLTGRKPYAMTSNSPDEMLRAITTQEVTRPSQAVLRAPVASSQSEGVETTPRSPSAPPSVAGPPDHNRRRLRRRLEGDLDTIVLRALAKDPSRRYASVVQLSHDLRRHLAGMPIHARPDRLGYRARKFLKRNRMAAAAVFLVLLSLCAGMVATLRQARIATAQRAAAERRFAEVRDLARTLIFEVHDAVATLPGSTPVRKRIVALGLQYLEQLEREAEDDHDLQAELAAAYERIAAVQGGVGQANLGDIPGSIRSQRHALALRSAVASSAPGNLNALLALARTRSTLGDLLGSAGDRPGRRREYAAALALRNSAAARFPDAPLVRRAVASSLWDNAQLKVDDGDLKGGLTSFEEALALYHSLAQAPEASGEDRRNLALAHKKIGAVRCAMGDLAGALTNLETALGIDKERLVANPHNPETLLDVSFDHGDLGHTLLQLGQAREAVVHYVEAVTLRQKVAAADPLDVRARAALRSGQARLAAALTAASEEPATPCDEVLRYVSQARALWRQVAAAGPLDADAEAQRARLDPASARCSARLRHE